jgi:hypothetical protein
MGRLGFEFAQCSVEHRDRVPATRSIPSLELGDVGR